MCSAYSTAACPGPAQRRRAAYARPGSHLQQMLSETVRVFELPTLGLQLMSAHDHHQLITAPPRHHPFDRRDINEHPILFVDSSKTLARMALVCPAWWLAARRAAGYRLRALAGYTSSVWALASLPVGLVASGSDDRTAAIWRVADDVGQ